MQAAGWLQSTLIATIPLLVAFSASAQVPSDATAASELAAIRAAPNGLVTVDALDLPEPFLRHIVDWEVRNAWRRTYHRVQALDATARADQPPAAPALGPQPQMGVGPTVLNAELLRLDPRMMDVWMDFSFDVPELRGFRAPLGALADDPWPFHLLQRDPDDPQAQRYRQAAKFVAANLARDGLIRTVMRLMKDIEAPAPWLGADGTLKTNRLRAVGVPVDLLDMFTIDGRPAPQFIAKWMSDGMTADIDAVTARAAFNFAPSCAGFKVMAEDGSAVTGALRFQLPTNRFRDGEGDGSALDVFRQIAMRDPATPIIVSIHGDGMNGLLDEMRRWNIPKPGRIVIAPQPANITQWAQDNARTGHAATRADAPLRAVMLAPRYASRTELRSVCVPSDSLVMETLRRGFAGSIDIAQSPLLFQGGNCMAVADPKTGRRVLLIGEAEVHRNRALGLTHVQVLNAFKMEFGVDACELIPAASLHIDLDFTIRRCGNELVACVADDVAAARLIAAETARALGRGGAIPTAEVDPMTRAMLTNGPGTAAAAAALNRAIDAHRDANGVISSRFPAMLASSDSSAARLAAMDASQRVLAAVDVFTAAAMTDAQLAAASVSNSRRSYLQCLRATHAQLDSIAARLQRLGMRVERVPALSDREVSVNPINGLHMGDRYLMPACGGLFEPVDQAAHEAFGRAFGPGVRIEFIDTSAVQTTDGGLHCMIAVLPR